MWLARLSHPIEPERERVYALKILRKVDSELLSLLVAGLVRKESADDGSSHPSQASRACAE